MDLFEKHKDILSQAIHALHERTFFAAYPEHPSPKIYGETADEEGRKKFQTSLEKKFEELKQIDETDWIGAEESPYMQDKLGIAYPSFTVESLVENGKTAFHQWRKVRRECNRECSWTLPDLLSKDDTCPPL